MDELGAGHSTNNDGSDATANSALEITHKQWLRLLEPYLRMREHLSRLKPLYDAPDADRLSLGVWAHGEVLRFLQSDPWFRQTEADVPLTQIVFALNCWSNGKRHPLIFDRAPGRGHKELPSIDWLRAAIAHPAAVLRAGDKASGAFAPGKAAKEVAVQLEKRGFKVPVPRMKGEFIGKNLVWQWHNSAAGGYANELTCNIFKMRQNDFARRYPEHTQWSKESRRKWLLGYITGLCRLARAGSFL